LSTGRRRTTKKKRALSSPNVFLCPTARKKERKGERKSQPLHLSLSSKRRERNEGKGKKDRSRLLLLPLRKEGESERGRKKEVVELYSPSSLFPGERI